MSPSSQSSSVPSFSQPPSPSCTDQGPTRTYLATRTQNTVIVEASLTTATIKEHTTPVNHLSLSLNVHVFSLQRRCSEYELEDAQELRPSQRWQALPEAPTPAHPSLTPLIE